MGYFRNINFNNFRNFSNFSLDFEKNCNVFFGKNGSGKTNLLEGISLFEKGKGFRKDKINNLININNPDVGFSINTIFQNKKIDYKINIHNFAKNTKKLTVNDSLEKESLKHFESFLSIIYFLPEMERLFLLTPSYRRNFLDRLIYNYNKKYNLTINNYKKTINERYHLLKGNIYDEDWVQSLEKNIVKLGSTIYFKRIEQLKIINNILINLDISNNFLNKFFLKIEDKFLIEFPNIYNEPEKYLSQLIDNRISDVFSGGCLIGPHRSDILGYTLIDNFNINQFSTGQQKTVILLIIISQCKYLIENLNIQPVILLDEICSHLDKYNRELLLYLIDQLNVQVFMTGTEESFFSFLSTKAHYCNIA